MSKVVTYWWVIVSGRAWNHEGMTWEAADAKRDELRGYYGPEVPIHLESITTHANIRGE